MEITADIFDYDLDFVRRQLSDLACVRYEIGLNQKSQARYLALCDREMRLLEGALG